MSKQRTLANALGWIGVVLIIACYGLNVFGSIASDGFAYFMGNLAGALMLCYSSYYKRDWQPVVLNTIWALIAISGMLSGLFS